MMDEVLQSRAATLSPMHQVVPVNPQMYVQTKALEGDHARGQYGQCQLVRIGEPGSVAGRDDPRSLQHQHHGALGDHRSVLQPLGHDERLARPQLHRVPALRLNLHPPLQDKEEFILLLVPVPVELALDHSSPDCGAVHFAQRLVEPGIGYAVDHRLDVELLQGAGQRLVLDPVVGHGHSPDGWSSTGSLLAQGGGSGSNSGLVVALLEQL